MGIDEAAPEKGVVVKNRAIGNQPLDLAMVKVGSKEVWVTPNTKLSGFSAMKEIKINQKVKVTYKETSRGLEAETLSESVDEAKYDVEAVADYLANDVDDDSNPQKGLAYASLGLDTRQATGLIGAWYKIDPKARLKLSMNNKEFFAWIKKEVGF